MRHYNLQRGTIGTYRASIEKRLREILEKDGGTTTLDDVKRAVYDAKPSDIGSFFVEIFGVLRNNGVHADSGLYLELAEGAWNYFPHRSLNGQCPAERFGMLEEEDPIAAWARGVDPDFEKIDTAALALLMVGLHANARVWKSHDWGVLDRLHARGLISDPRSKAKSVTLTEVGLKDAQRAFEALFCHPLHP